MKKNIRWAFPKDTLKRSIEIMRPHGACGNEGLALWFGMDEGPEIEITHVIDVSGPGFKTNPLHMSLSMRAMAVLTELAEKLDRYLVGQIHSHPGQFLDLSWVDIENGIRIANYLSLVCPYYAQQNLMGFGDCGVHVFESGSFRRLSLTESTQRLIVRTGSISVIKCEVPL